MVNQDDWELAPLDLNPIEKRFNDAYITESWKSIWVNSNQEICINGHVIDEQEKNFILNAPTDIVALMTEVEELRQKLTKLSSKGV
jgi:hypothetical protein